MCVLVCECVLHPELIEKKYQQQRCLVFLPLIDWPRSREEGGGGAGES